MRHDLANKSWQPQRPQRPQRLRCFSPGVAKCHTKNIFWKKKKTRQRHRGSTILTNDQTPLKKKRTHKNKQKKECDFWMLRSCYSCSWESSKNRITIITMSPWHVTLPFVSAQLHSFGLAAWDSWQRGRMIWLDDMYVCIIRILYI